MPEDWIAWIATDTGSVRERNEDRCFAGQWLGDGSDGAWSVRLEAGHWCAAVTDGMGGHHAGELASTTAIAELRPLADGLTSARAVSEALEQVNEKVFEAMYSPHGRPGMGCTVAGVTVHADEATFFNVGDSRAYVVCGREMVRHSVDHTPSGGIGQPFRSHMLTQSLGGTSRRTPLSPFVRKVRLDRGNVVILCSDGLTDMLTEEDIIDVLNRGPANPAQALTQAAVDAGGHDNVTVIVVGTYSGSHPPE